MAIVSFRPEQALFAKANIKKIKPLHFCQVKVTNFTDLLISSGKMTSN